MKVIREDIEVRVLKEPLLEKSIQETKSLGKIIKFIKDKMTVNQKTKKLVISVFAGYFLLLQNPVAIATATDAPSAPEAPSAPDAPSYPSSDSSWENDEEEENNDHDWEDQNDETSES